MRLITRSDFDGLACGALLKEAGIIDHWKFAHPKDLQDGLVEVTEDDCLANVPFVEGCGLWFDHHSSEHERMQLEGKYKGESRVTPSCARIIYEYYGGKEKFPQFDDMMEAVDKVDSGNLTIDDVQNPKGWVLIGFFMDPRTGLGRWRDFTISNYQLMEKLIEAYKTVNPNATLELQTTDSTTGVSGALDGTYTIGMASRELKDSEVEGGAKATVLAKDGIAVIVSNDNPTDNLTVDQIKGIYTGELTTWADVQ